MDPKQLEAIKDVLEKNVFKYVGRLKQSGHTLEIGHGKLIVFGFEDDKLLISAFDPKSVNGWKNIFKGPCNDLKEFDAVIIYNRLGKYFKNKSSTKSKEPIKHISKNKRPGTKINRKFRYMNDQEIEIWVDNMVDLNRSKSKGVGEAYLFTLGLKIGAQLMRDEMLKI